MKHDREVAPIAAVGGDKSIVIDRFPDDHDIVVATHTSSDALADGAAPFIVIENGPRPSTSTAGSHALNRADCAPSMEASR